MLQRYPEENEEVAPRMDQQQRITRALRAQSELRTQLAIRKKWEIHIQDTRQRLRTMQRQGTRDTTLTTRL